MDDETDPAAGGILTQSYASWRAQMLQEGEEAGFGEPLGALHHAVFREEGDTLLVSFESFPGIQATSETGYPLGEAVAEGQGWSHLSLISRGDTWFRDGEVFTFIDQLNDDGFFDDFDRVIFYGAGPCGYAAAAFSVASPGAIVVLLQPQATLGPRVTEWDDRFTEMRRVSFTDRYGFAPRLTDGAQAVHLFYDPREPLDAMHSALFERPNVTRYRMPSMGSALQADFCTLDLLEPVLTGAAEGRLDRLTFARLYRRRRDHIPYLRRLLAQLERVERTYLLKLLCLNVTERLPGPRFRRVLRTILAQEATESGRRPAEFGDEPATAAPTDGNPAQVRQPGISAAE